MNINTIPSDREYLDVKEVMEILGMERKQVMKLIKSWVLVGNKFDGRMYWVTVESVKQVYQSAGTFKN